MWCYLKCVENEATLEPSKKGRRYVQGEDDVSLNFINQEKLLRTIEENLNERQKKIIHKR